MNLKVFLDVAIPGPGMSALHGINWIIAFVIIAFVIAIVSVIIIRRGVKKAKMEEEKRIAEEKAASGDVTGE